MAELEGGELSGSRLAGSGRSEVELEDLCDFNLLTDEERWSRTGESFDG